MNFSVHLPDPLLRQLDQFANANAKSRSSVVREAVSEYIAAHTANTWPDELAAWMKSAPKKSPSKRPDATDKDWPDFDAIRKESNASATKRASAL
jgi:predicted transcriptional regulator